MSTRSIQLHGVSIVVVLFWSLSATISFATAQSSTDNRAVASGRNDVVYLAPATEPYEALPLGNGQLGVMVGNRPGMNYLFCPGSFFASADQNQALIASGELSIHLPEEWTKGFVEERLILHDGTIATQFKTSQGVHKITSWIAEGTDLLVVEIESSSPLPDFQAELTTSARPSGLEPQITAASGEAALTSVGLSNDRATSLLLQALPGTVAAKADGEHIKIRIAAGGKKRLTLLVANPVVRGKLVTAEDARNEARRLIDKTRQEGLPKFRQMHNDWWHSFWAKSSILMHSDDGFADYLENEHNLFLYWMAGMSRGPDAPKFNGGNYLFCNDWRFWGGGYWYQNTREMYWPLLATDHTELWAPLVDLYCRHLPAFKKVARELFGVDGASFQETLSGFDGGGDKAVNTYMYLYLTTGTEVAHQFYQYYLYTGDEPFLREKVYPLMKEAITFHLNFLNREADGLYHVYPSDARETYWWIKDSTPDLSAIRATLPILIGISKKLGRDEKDRAHWQEVFDHLAPFVVDTATDVILPGTFLDVYPKTRFAKAEALYTPDQRTTKAKGNPFNCENVACDPIYPWGLFAADSPREELDRMRNTFRRRSVPSWGLGNAWDASAIWAARLGLVDEAVRSLAEYARDVQMYPSGLAVTATDRPIVWGKVLGDSPGFDGTGVAAAAIQELQLRSCGGKIWVFPCWPKGWQGEFTLAAEGGFKVAACIGKDGQIPAVEILSRQGGLCNLINPWKTDAMLRHEDDNQRLTAGEMFTFPTVAGERYTLTPAQGAQKPAPLAAVKNVGPKWPQHSGPNDTAEAYVKRNMGFGFIGITADGQNPARTRVKQALHAKPVK